MRALMGSEGMEQPTRCLHCKSTSIGMEHHEGRVLYFLRCRRCGLRGPAYSAEQFAIIAENEARTHRPPGQVDESEI